MAETVRVDFLIVGGGFYGCCLALFLRSVSRSILVVEAGDQPLDRASRVNQARIHTGFHYPRSALTAIKSMALNRRFAADFSEAVVDDFTMLYAIARKRSKVSAKRFFRMFRDIGAPIAPASPNEAALFDPGLVSDVFRCGEAAFDYAILRSLIRDRMTAAQVPMALNSAVEGLSETADGVVATLSDGTRIEARYAFNVTYSNINALLSLGGLHKARLKHEYTEIALLEPPEVLKGLGITIMDGPFFSFMPYPAERLHSLTHVRFTPHRSWTDDDGAGPVARADPSPGKDEPSRHIHMLYDSRRYVPSLADARYRRSIYEVKSVLLKNEQDDGRPILYQRIPARSRVISILGGKIDNIYDLFNLVRQSEPEFAAATEAFVTGRRGER